VVGKKAVAGLFALMAAAGLGGWAADETPAEQELVGGLAFVDEVEVTVVNIEVFVRDKDGNPVTDLGIEDFRVFQDGEERELTNFLLVTETVREAYTEAAAAPETPALEEAEAPPRPEIQPVHIVVYVDDENLMPFDRNRVLSHLRRFLADTVRENVRAMIVANQGSPKIIQPFTSDADELAVALRELRKSSGGRTSSQSQHAALKRDIDRLRNEESSRIGKEDPLTQNAALVLDDLMAYADQVNAEMLRDIAAVRMVGAGLTGLPGRKCLVYVSSGLPMVIAKDLFYEFSNMYKGVSYLSLTARYNKRADFRELAAAANSQGMVFYTIDGRGLAPQLGVSAERGVAGDPAAAAIGQMNTEEPLVYIAERTGGLSTVGTNDFEGGLEKIREDLFTYYSLGYPVTAVGGDRVHRIKVELPNHPGLDVRYRKTFVEKSRESEVQDRVMTALLFDIDENPMKIDAAVSEATAAQSGRWMLPLRVSFPTQSVALLPQGDHLVGEVVLYVSLRDRGGKYADLQHRVQEIYIPRSEYERMASQNLSIDLQLLVESGRYRVAVGLFDRLTRQASYQVISASTPDAS
jgi:VWFA-related protein